MCIFAHPSPKFFKPSLEGRCSIRTPHFERRRFCLCPRSTLPECSKCTEAETRKRQARDAAQAAALASLGPPPQPWWKQDDDGGGRITIREGVVLEDARLSMESGHVGLETYSYAQATDIYRTYGSFLQTSLKQYYKGPARPADKVPAAVDTAGSGYLTRESLSCGMRMFAGPHWNVSHLRLLFCDSWGAQYRALMESYEA